MSKAFDVIKSVKQRLMVWAFSVAAIVVVPMIPLFVEYEKHGGSIKDESYYMTAAVLAAGFGFTSEGYFFRTGYLVLFIWSIVANFKPEQAEAAVGTGTHYATLADWSYDHTALLVILLTALVQVVERFNWHVVLDRRFPDWLEKS